MELPGGIILPGGKNLSENKVKTEENRVHRLGETADVSNPSDDGGPSLAEDEDLTVLAIGQEIAPLLFFFFFPTSKFKLVFCHLWMKESRLMPGARLYNVHGWRVGMS